jgi:hypothetical protein
MVLRFQALKEKEDPLADDAPAETPFGDHHEIASLVWPLMVLNGKRERRYDFCCVGRYAM